MVKNRSSKVLWVVNNDRGPVEARKLRPGHRSPPDCDADGFKAVDGTSVDGHTSWVKIRDISTADVTDAPDGTLRRGCFICGNVSETAFGPVTYIEGDWGIPI